MLLVVKEMKNRINFENNHQRTWTLHVNVSSDK